MNIIETTFNNKKAIEIINQDTRMVVLVESGPRIAFFGRTKGENLLFWDETEEIKRGNWRIKGGHRVWVTRPMADECEDSYRPDNLPCEVRQDKDRVTILGATDPVLQTIKGFEINTNEEGEFLVNNFVKNESEVLYSAGVWALTCSKPHQGCEYIIPLGDGSDWDCFRVVFFRQWGGHTSSINDSQIIFQEDSLKIVPQGFETKRLVESSQGIIAMNVPDQNLSFIKKVSYEQNGNHPLGCNLAFYVAPDNLFVEMESMSGEKTVKPGQTIYWQEKWKLNEGLFQLK